MIVCQTHCILERLKRITCVLEQKLTIEHKLSAPIGSGVCPRATCTKKSLDRIFLELFSKIRLEEVRIFLRNVKVSACLPQNIYRQADRKRCYNPQY